MPTVENRLACGMFAVVALLFLLCCFSVHGWLWIPFVLYAGSLSAGAWRVRPWSRRGTAFFVLFLPVLLQAACYMLFISRVTFGWATGSRVLRFDPATRSIAIASAIAGLAGWLPSALLLPNARRGVLLLTAQIAGPVGLFFWWMAILIVASSGMR